MAGFARFDDSEFQAFIKHFDDEVQGEAFLREIEKAFRDMTAKTLKIVKKRSPVDTGMLRRNWGAGNFKSEHGNLMVEIFNNMDYAIYVEEGHRTPGGGGWVEGQHFLRDGIDDINSIMEEVMGIAFERALANILEG